VPSESEILTAIGNGGLIEEIDPLYYAAMLRIQLEGKNPVLWAIANGKKIDGKDPLYYALLNEGFDVNKSVLEAVPEGGYKINVSDEVSYTVDEFKTKIVESIINKQDFGGLNTQKLMKIAINGNFMINGKSPIQYAIENHTNGLQQGVKSILKEQGRDDQLKEFYQNLANDPAENSQLIEFFANEFNSSGRGKENFVEVMCPLVEQEIKVPDSLVELYIKDKLDKNISLINEIHQNHKEQALFSVIDLYLESTQDQDKTNLKVMYEKLAKDLNLNTKQQDSALVQFVSDPEECANKIKNLLNKLPKQDKSDLNIEGSAQNIDLKNLYKQYDLETLKNLNDVGNKLGEIEPEVQNFSIAGKIGIGIGIALAIITVIPGIIIGIIKLVSDSNAKQEFKDQQSEALKINNELGKLSVVKAHGEGVQANSAGAKKFTETVLNMRSAHTTHEH
jgi:hypothetical protein